MPMECVEAKGYDFEDVCETGATGCEETCIWSVGQLWNISSGVRRGLCCNELHVVKLVIGESSIRWLETNSLLPSSRLHLMFETSSSNAVAHGSQYILRNPAVI
jgi:hypothetical protein